MALTKFYLDPTVISDYIVTLTDSAPAKNDVTKIAFVDKFTGVRYYPFIPNLINLNDYDTDFCTKKTEEGPLYYVCAWRPSNVESAAYETKKWKLRFKLKVTGRCEEIDIIGRIYTASQTVPTPEQISLVTGAEFTIKIPINQYTQFQNDYTIYNCEVTIPGFDPTGNFLFLILNAKITNKDNDEKLWIELEQGQDQFIDALSKPIGNTSAALIYDTEPIPLENSVDMSEIRSDVSFFPKVININIPSNVENVESVILASIKSQNTIPHFDTVTNINLVRLECNNDLIIYDNTGGTYLKSVLLKNTQTEYFIFTAIQNQSVVLQHTQMEYFIFSDYTPLIISDIVTVTTTYANGPWVVSSSKLDTGDWDRVANNKSI